MINYISDGKSELDREAISKLPSFNDIFLKHLPTK